MLNLAATEYEHESPAGGVAFGRQEKEPTLPQITEKASQASIFVGEWLRQAWGVLLFTIGHLVAFAIAAARKFWATVRVEFACYGTEMRLGMTNSPELIHTNRKPTDMGCWECYL